MKKKILVFASGNGSNFEAIVKYFKKSVDIELLTDIKNCYALSRAKKLGIKAHYVPFKDTFSYLKKMQKFDLYVLAGYMRILPKCVLDLGIFINIHPSLLPDFKGVNAIKRAFDAGEKQTGVSVHYVVPQVDAGEIIMQKTVETDKKNLEELEAEIHKIEHEIYPKVIEKLLEIRVLVLGGGAREHALAYKISTSKIPNKLYLAAPNDGFRDLGEVIEFRNYADLVKKAVQKGVNLAVIGAEAPLAEGVSDMFAKAGIDCIGAVKKWAKLEYSKHFAKKFMQKHKIPTAEFVIANKKSDVNKIINKFKKPPVIKADGLCAGKGVVVTESFDEAKNVLTKFLQKYEKAVVEENLCGEELSVIALYDGVTLLPFATARDYKRLSDNNKGANTGGMGSYSPVKLTNKQEIELQRYLKQLENALKKDGADFKGVVYSGLMLTAEGIKVLEYNMRFGDPETQAIMTGLKSDLLELFLKTARTQLKNTKIEFEQSPSICVVAASSGYPENPKKGCVIKNVDEIRKKYGVEIFFAGVKKEGNTLLSNGGRVLSVCLNTAGKDFKKARENIYKAIENLKFDDKIYRKDIALWKS